MVWVIIGHFIFNEQLVACVLVSQQLNLYFIFVSNNNSQYICDIITAAIKLIVAILFTCTKKILSERHK